MSWSKMLHCLLFITICFTICNAEASGKLPPIFKPVVMYASPNSAVIKWEELRRNQEKDGYIIEYGKNWKNSKTIQVSRGLHTAMIPNLEPDTLYNIRIRVPDATKGSASYPGPSVSFRTSSAVSARIGVPQSIVVVPLPLYKLLVTWDLPYRARDSDVVHYSLVFAPVYSPYFRKTSLLLPGHYKSFTLTYLRPNTLYKVKIAALLKSRKGPYSAWVIAQTFGQARLENPTQPITKSLLSKTTSPKPKETTALQTTGISVGLITDMRENPTQSTTKATEKKILVTSGKTNESITLPAAVKPSERERSTTTQTTQETTTIQRTTTPTPTHPHTTPQVAETTTSTPLPSQHTEQVSETTHQTQLKTEGTKAQTTEQIEQQTTVATPPSRKTTIEHKNLPTIATTLHTTEDAKLSTEKSEQITERQPTKQTTKQVRERMTQGTLQQPSTQSSQQTTQKPTSSYLETNTAMSGIVDQPTTGSAVTDQHVTDAQFFTSNPSPRQPSAIITPSSTTMPSLVITGTLPTSTRPPPQYTCEVMERSMCSDIGYKTTKMASKVKRQSQMMEHVKSMWSQLTPLCQSHAKLKQFLCAASFPYCSKNLGGPFLPCRSMCMATKKSCNMNSKDWPDELDCSNFPDVGESAICISYGHESAASTTTTIQVAQSTPVPPTDPASQAQISSLTTESSDLASNPASVEPKTPPNHCEPLYLKACEGVGYKYVQFPNFFNQTHQNDAGRKISKYWPLIEVKCSPLFQLFLCSLYAPICTSTVARNMLPCRSLCQRVSTDCSYYMEVYGLVWPGGITCEDFPDTHDGTCLSQKYLTSLRQGNVNVVPTFPTTTKNEADQVKSRYKRPSTKATLLTSAGANSVEQELTTVESIPYSAAKPISVTKEREKPTRPKTGKNLKVHDHAEYSTEAIAQRNEGEFTSSINPMTSASANMEAGQHLTITKSNSIFSPKSPVITTPPPGCESIYLKMCQGVGYDFTQFPNFFNHNHQNDAGREMYRFWPLVESYCSPKLQLFLCSLYTPVCTKTLSSAKRMTGSLTNNILPCRSLCHQVKRECRTIMKLYGLKWPQDIECTRFPTDGEKTCIYGKTNDTGSKGLLKITKAKESPKIPSTPLPGTCRPLPPDHPCKNHYKIASLLNASETFENTRKFIENHTSKIKDLASKKCLRNLEMFLCSVNIPRCSENGTVFGPCRSQCKTTFRRCGSTLLEKINFQIVTLKECRRFPVTQCTDNNRRSKAKSKSVESL